MFSPSLENYQTIFNSISHPTELQLAAFEQFQTSGFPKRTIENWKYTSVAALLNTEFQQHVIHSPINGHEPQHLTNYTPTKHAHPFRYLNSALSDQVEVITIGKDGQHHLEFSLSKNTARMSHYQIDVLENVHAELFVTYKNEDDSANFENNQFNINLAKNASLTIYRHQHLNQRSFVIDYLTVNQNQNSYLYLFTLDKGAELSRIDIEVNLNEPGSECSLNGFYSTKNKQHFDHHSLIHHHASHCTSSEFFRGLVDDHSRAVFNGKIIFPKNAQKSKTQQMNNNILLSSTAEVDTKPELEIYADDVQASHGATVGQIDANALFYLKSRGLTHTQAHHILIHAFAAEVFETIKSAEIKEQLLSAMGMENSQWD